MKPTPHPELSKKEMLAAVRAGRLVIVDGNAYLNRSGPRIVDSLEILGHAIHPERYSAPPHEGWEAM